MDMRKKTAKEKIYDEQIAPLMTEILSICMKHNIAMFSYSHLEGPEDEKLAATSLVYDKASPTYSRQNNFVSMFCDIAMAGADIVGSHIDINNKGKRGLFNPEFLSREQMDKIMDQGEL